MEFVALVCGLIVIGCYLILVTKEHAYFIHQNYGVDHELAALKRACLFVMFGLLTTYAGGFWFSVICLELSVALWWFAFDLILNQKRSLGPLYVGYTAEIDIWFRGAINHKLAMKIFKDVKYLMLAAKVIAILLGIGALIGYWIIVYYKPELAEIKIV